MSHSTKVSGIINAPLKKVWDALTVPVQVKQYFFNTNMETTWEVSTPIFFRGEWQGKTYEDKGMVLSFNPMESFSYTYWSGFSGMPDKPENYQTLVFDLKEVSGGVELTISQSNVATQEGADHSAENWKGVLAGLKKFVE